MTKCKLCEYDSHCDRPLKDEQCCGEQVVIICPKCQCELCEKDYARWVQN